LSGNLAIGHEAPAGKNPARRPQNTGDTHLARKAPRRKAGRMAYAKSAKDKNSKRLCDSPMSFGRLATVTARDYYQPDDGIRLIN
jgi:hypothetical protein